MRAYQLQPQGSTALLTLADLPVPEPKSGEILIKVRYCGLNRADVFQREGMYPMPEATNMIPGLEVSGEIAGVGEGVTGWKTGDKVCALMTIGGGYAEYVTVAAEHVLPVPDGLGLKEAASLPEALATVWLAFFNVARLKVGERVLIHGGASGVGIAAIQLAKLFGAHPIVTAGGAEKCAACEKLGAAAINYKTEDFVSRVKALTEEKGVDVVLDMVAGDYVERNLKCLGARGRMVTISFIRGAKIEANLAGLLMKNIQWTGMTLRSRTRAEKAAILLELKEKVWPLLAEGKFTPVIDRVFAFAEVEKAQKHMRESLHIGKILLEV